MATITPSVQPGYFLDHQTINFSFSNDVTEVAVTTGDIPPSLSKYIAYDTLTPPNPFIAVTEDGRGRVVYDGGFPKFYNGNIPDWTNVATRPKTFSALIASHKFLYNALNWVANPTKVSSGNKKVLILGDKNPGTGTGNADDSGANYYIITDETRPDGFKATFDTILAAAGYTPTYKLPSQFAGNTIDVRLSELEQYCCVILLSSDYANNARITAASVNDFTTYRSNGNGIILITDHGDALTSIDQVNNNTMGGFFKTVNAIAARMGAYFTGNFDRVPVNVGFLRTNYGDHPLYNGMANTDSIVAGDSESQVVVSKTTTYPPGSVPPVTTTINGMNTVNVLVRSVDGTITTARYTYIVAGDEILFVKATDGTNQFVNTDVMIGIDGALEFSVETKGAALGTLWGEYILNGKRVGAFQEIDGVTGTNSYVGNRLRAKPGDVFVVRMMTPFSYSKTLNVRSKTPDLRSKVSLSRINKAIATAYGATQFSALKSLQKSYNDNAEFKNKVFTNVGRASLFKSVWKGLNPATNKYSCAMYPTDAGCINSVSNAGARIMVNHAFNTTTGALIAWHNGGVKVVPGTLAKDILPARQIIVSNSADSPGTWQLDASGNFVKIA